MQQLVYGVMRVVALSYNYLLMSSVYWLAVKICRVVKAYRPGDILTTMSGQTVEGIKYGC